LTYALFSDVPFSTQKDIILKRKVSNEARSIKNYIDNHVFLIEVDSLTRDAKIKVENVSV
jgi:hypothetical protein